MPDPPPRGDDRAPRIVSLLPSATEIVCGLGARDGLVGISHECDFPPDVACLPVLTSAKMAASPSSAAIDRSVREVLRDALAVYDIDTAKLRELAPDVIVTQDLCDVCAVSLDDVRRAVRDWAGPDTRVVSLRPGRLGDVLDDLDRTATAIGREVEARTLRGALEARIESVRQRAAQAVADADAHPDGRVAADGTNPQARPKVLTIEWIDPVMPGGTWMPELIELAGGEPLVTKPGDHAPTLDPGALRALAPDVVLVKPCGFDLARSETELDRLREVLPWDRWPAVREGRVWLADGNAYFNRPGPRIVDSLEILAACLWPERFRDFVERYAPSLRRIDRDAKAIPIADAPA